MSDRRQAQDEAIDIVFMWVLCVICVAERVYMYTCIVDVSLHACWEYKLKFIIGGSGNTELHQSELKKLDLTLLQEMLQDWTLLFPDVTCSA